ncbi:MAG: NAD(+) synthase [Clostridiales bacterium]|nr:NAD(+) synthase [Clostridiales bacterium]
MKEQIIQWIRDYFEQNGKGCNAVIGISGGKDSSVCAALLVEALGKDRVIGVLMPQGNQHDIQMSYDLVAHLGIKHYVVNIGAVCDSLVSVIDAGGINKDDLLKNKVYYSNTPARVRMTVLYGISAMFNGRVANTCNKSEDYVGYSTKFGDSAGDFSPLSDLLVKEVKALGYELGLPKKFIEKIPEDGLSGKSDEDNLGFTYAVLDRYIETGEIDDPVAKEKIDRLHKANLHKITPMPMFKKIKN